MREVEVNLPCFPAQREPRRVTPLRASGKKHRICWEGKPLGETDDCNRSNLSVRPSVSDVITSRGCPVISNTPTL